MNQKQNPETKKVLWGRLNLTFESTMLFSGQATITKHSISTKLASLAGLSFPPVNV